MMPCWIPLLGSGEKRREKGGVEREREWRGEGQREGVHSEKDNFKIWHFVFFKVQVKIILVFSSFINTLNIHSLSAYYSVQLGWDKWTNIPHRIAKTTETHY